MLMPKTQLVATAQAPRSLHVEFKAVDLLAQGAGAWDLGEFKSKVGGEAPILELVEFASASGFGGIPFPEGLGGERRPHE
jgi:hypothetical protein